MAVPTFTISCISKHTIARSVVAFTFSKPEGFAFKAGQFVLFDVPLIENPEDIQTRALSIASAPQENELLFVAKMKDGGRISRWIEEVLDVGTVATIKGPFGNFKINTETSHEYAFIATSTGVAPFRSMILEALEQGITSRMDLIFGVRSEEDLFWKEECEKLAQDHQNVFVHFALSSPSGEWTGHRGRVQTLVPLIIRNFLQRSVYVCGSPEMTKELKQLCLDEWKVEKKDLHVEGYI